MNLVDVKKNFPQYLEKVVGTFDLLEGMGLLVDRVCNVEIWSGAGAGGCAGAYDPGARLLKVYEDCIEAGYGEMTLVHEYGHHLSLPFGESEYEFQGRFIEDNWNLWYRAVKDSSVVRRLRDLESDEKESWSVRDYAAYLGDWRELFARSFSQWVAVRAGSVELIAQHDRALLDTNGVFVWGSEEFEYIAVCMDKIFG